MTIFGWDMSHYDAPDIGNAIAQGISFITHKAGGDASDAELAAWWSDVKGLDPDQVLLGAYWVLYPGSPSARADAFIARLDAVCSGWRDRPFLLQVDCEKWAGNSSTIPPISDINAFCDRLVARLPRLRPVGYLPDWVYGDISGFRYPLWSSKYVAGSGSFASLYPGDAASEWAGYGGKSPQILQYSSSATIGGQTTCDANAYRGALADLVALVAPGWEIDMTTVDLTDAAVSAVAAAVKAAMTTTAKFADAAGGDHNPISDAVWNAATIPGADGKRTHAWEHLSSIPTTAEIAQAVLDQLGGQDVPVIAASLRAVLGDKAAAVGAALTASATS